MKLRVCNNLHITSVEAVQHNTLVVYKNTKKRSLLLVKLNIIYIHLLILKTNLLFVNLVYFVKKCFFYILSQNKPYYIIKK